jgi:hypothetical protein
MRRQARSPLSATPTLYGETRRPASAKGFRRSAGASAKAEARMILRAEAERSAPMRRI